MKKLEDYVNVLAFVLSSATGCTWSAVNSPKIEPTYYPEIYCYNLYEIEDYTICEYDVNSDGKIEWVEKKVWGSKNHFSKRLTDYGADGSYEKEENFTYNADLGTLKQIVKFGSETSIHEYADGKIKRDLYDSDSDGNFETTYIHNKDGTITYLGDENDDGRADVISEDVNAAYASSFDPDGNQGLAYQRIVKLSRDLDFNGKFDHTELFFIKSSIVGELILHDKNQDGNVDLIRKREYDSRGNLVLEKFDRNGDKKWDSTWKQDTGWVNLN